MLIKPGRLDRQASTRKGAPAAPVPQPAVPYTFKAPWRGWVTNESIAAAQPGGASVLDNFWPDRNALTVRGGVLLHATVHASNPCETLMTYRSGTAQKLFGSTSAVIYNITAPGSPTAIPSADWSGQTNGDYSWANIATVGGEFLVVANGVDKMAYYDGSTWRTLDNATTELPFDTQTVNYGAGLVVTGGTSGATGTIVSVIDNGATGTLRLRAVTGTFQDNELVTASTGSATSNIPTGVTSVPAITGVTTSDISHIWLSQSRLFMVKKDSRTAYCLPVDSIGGAVTTISLDGVFQKGGEIMVGATWSTDAGDGADDKCVFISTQGEVAIYEGSNPASATTWRLGGLFQMPSPMHKNAVMKAGGNLLVVTEYGLIPITAALKSDLAAITLEAVSFPIEPTWLAYVTARAGKWTVGKWAAKNRAIIGFPQDAKGNKANFAINLQTGAWSRFTGWDVRCAVELDGDLYFGTPDGKVMKAESLGSDNGANYSCLYVGLYERLGGASQEISVRMARSSWVASTKFNYKVNFAFNYSYNAVTYPSVSAESISDLWDTGLWDTAIWDASGVSEIITNWQSAHGHGFAIAPMVQLTMGTNTVPDVKLIAIDVICEQGAMVS